MDFAELLKRRTIRFFRQEAVPEAELCKLIDAARVASCGANAQLLRYMVIRTPELAEKIFYNTAYAAKVQPRRNPVWGVTAPQTFIAVLAPEGKAEADAGAAVQSMEFAAYNSGLGSCWIGSFNRGAVQELLTPPAGLQVRYLLAVGYPAEAHPVQEDIGLDGDPAYYLDEQDRLHVPKYTVEALTSWR
ncbi:MAG: nitroreductase family protein [Lentisphaeria bacterium]|nr:nitroreductase family protein [Lentisphaeria bacterium]